MASVTGWPWRCMVVRSCSASSKKPRRLGSPVRKSVFDWSRSWIDQALPLLLQGQPCLAVLPQHGQGIEHVGQLVPVLRLGHMQVQLALGNGGDQLGRPAEGAHDAAVDHPQSDTQQGQGGEAGRRPSTGLPRGSAPVRCARPPVPVDQHVFRRATMASMSGT